VEHVWHTDAAWVGLTPLAHPISMHLGLAAGLVEIVLGLVAGNLGTHPYTAIFQPTPGSISWLVAAQWTRFFYVGRDYRYPLFPLIGPEPGPADHPSGRPRGNYAGRRLMQTASSDMGAGIYSLRETGKP
jgi:hypothetical protein